MASREAPVSASGGPVRTGRLAFDPAADGRLTHYLFRYPAKFHPPVVKKLLAEYTRPGQRVLDPFCGSGTLLVEAAVADRHATGTDVDPVAVFVSSVKAKPISASQLERSLACLLDELIAMKRPDKEYEDRKWDDISLDGFAREAEGLAIPAIPNLHHWFRRYVTIDLARIKAVIGGASLPPAQHRFFMLVFASIIRAVSNADPVPVSGLEVTSYMQKRERAGRVINPFAIWEAAARRAISDMSTYRERVNPGTKVSAFQADATQVSRKLRLPVDAVITSPPYHGAVDYYRRHQLEMYWLDLTTSHAQRLELLQSYIGRTKIAARHHLLRDAPMLPTRETKVEAQMREWSPTRADAFRHYCVAMGLSIRELAAVLKPAAPALFVVGHSTWKHTALNTSDLFAELAHPYFVLSELLDYPVKNRYMSYSRRNGASIDQEFVLVMRRTRKVLSKEAIDGRR